jgi:hypothetical protein
LNSLLKNETTRAIPLVSKARTIIFGMDVSHGSPGSNVPSVAAVSNSFAHVSILWVSADGPRQILKTTIF